MLESRQFSECLGNRSKSAKGAKINGGAWITKLKKTAAELHPKPDTRKKKKTENKSQFMVAKSSSLKDKQC